MSYVFDSMENFNDKNELLERDKESINKWVDENTDKDISDMSVDQEENCGLAEIYKRNIKNNSA